MSDCIFCQQEKLEIILENNSAIAVYDIFPKTKGHALIILKRHAATYFDATLAELNEINSLLFEMKTVLDEKYSPDGYNVVSNVGAVSGQVIPHLHVHLIPRYKEENK